MTHPEHERKERPMEPRDRTTTDEEAADIDERGEERAPEDDEEPFDPDDDDLGRPVQLSR